MISDTFQYIPIEDTLKKLVQMPDVRKEIESSHASNDNTLRDMCDGSFFKSHPLFSMDSKLLHILTRWKFVTPLALAQKNINLGVSFFVLETFVLICVLG